MSQKYINGIIEQENKKESAYRENVILTDDSPKIIEGAREGYNSVRWNGSEGSDLIIVAKDIDLIADTTIIEGEEKILGFLANVDSSSFPADFLSAHDRYNLVVKIYGSFADPEYGNINVLGYTANHFCYMFNKNESGVIDFLQFMCYDALDKEGNMYHQTSLGISMADTYEIYYEGKSGDDTMLPKEGSKVSIYLQKLY